MTAVTLPGGQQVRVRATGALGVVLAAEEDGLYRVALAEGAQLIHGDELELAAPEPDQLLLAGELGEALPYALRLQALYLKHAYRYDVLSGLSNARIEPELHQVFVAHRVTQKLQPRMILADEVGLGKTIEAGLVIKELRARGLADRVLVVCPANLQLQWQQELRSKFNERFDVIDGAALKYLGRGGTNPWTKSASVICSLPFAAHPKRADQLVEADWDVVVFDEAHRVRRWLQGRREKVTQAYRLADELKELANGLLLLTATPMQLHDYELYSLIELVEPGLFPGYDTYRGRKADLPDLNRLVRGLRTWRALSGSEQEALVRNHRGWLEELGLDPEKAVAALAVDATREELVDELAQKHPLADVLVRNRKSEVGGFTGREASSIFVDLTTEEEEIYEAVTRYCRENYDLAVANKNLAVGFVMVTYQKMLASSSTAVRASLRRRIAKLEQRLHAPEATKTASKTKATTGPTEDQQEAEELSGVIPEFEGAVAAKELLAAEIALLEDLVERLGRVRDSKAVELVAALEPIFEHDPDDKVLIFTGFIETQSFLRAVLERSGLRVSVFNGTMSLDDKEEAVRVFRTTGQVLISTEAGGEGRNFQFCHKLFNYDLPWNPMKVEQRIGRVDRIGQKHTVQIYNLACRGTLEERVLEVLATRIGLFEESVGSLDPILGEVENDIVRLVMSRLDRSPELERLEVDLERRVREARERERTLADFALDRASLRRDVVNQLLEQQPLATHADLESYCGAVLEYSGGVLAEHSDGGMVISLSQDLGTQLRTRRTTVRGAFQPDIALELEDEEFFAFGNELVDRLVDLPIDFDPVVTGVRQDPSVASGTWVELWYEIESVSVQPFGRMVRHLVGENLEVNSEPVRRLPALGDRARQEPPPWSADAVAASRARFREEFLSSRERAQADMAPRKEEEAMRATRIFQYRQVRGQRIVDGLRAQVDEYERSDSERKRRILPAIRGRLAKEEERLARLRSDLEEQVKEIAGREARTSGRLLAAGLVVNS